MSDDRPTASRSDQPTRPAARVSPTRAESPEPRPAVRPPLTTEDVRRLTLYKWRYSLESFGFSGEEIGHLLFVKWMYATGAVRG